MQNSKVILIAKNNVHTNHNVCQEAKDTHLFSVKTFQVSKFTDGKVVDARCHALTASYVRARHHHDDSVHICSFFEVREIELNFIVVIAVGLHFCVQFTLTLLFILYDDDLNLLK